MATRRTRRKPAKPIRPKPTKPPRRRSREKKVRLQAHPQLTRSEIKRLQAKAAENMRSTGNYVAFLLLQHLSGRDSGRRRKAAARLGDKRISYTIGILLTPEQKAQLEAKTRSEVRSISNYVAKLRISETSGLPDVR